LTADICLESQMPNWDRYFIHGREMKYAASEDALAENPLFHYRSESRSG
jgi:hypothetical protein